MDPRALRRNFLSGLWAELRVVWPILSVLIGLMVALGLVVGWREGWSVQDSIYFAFVSGLTAMAISRPGFCSPACWRSRSGSAASC